jgi:hypothetical protein
MEGQGACELQEKEKGQRKCWPVMMIWVGPKTGIHQSRRAVKDQFQWPDDWLSFPSDTAQ